MRNFSPKFTVIASRKLITLFIFIFLLIFTQNSIKAQSTVSAIAGKGLENQEINTIVSSPGDSSTIFVGTSSGIYKSTDGGATWTSINNTGSRPFNTVLAIAFDPTNPANIFLGTDFGVFKGTSSGGNWVAKSQGILAGEQINALVISPNNANLLLAGGAGSGLYRSTDGATTWQKITNGFPDDLVLSLAIDPVNPNIVFAGTVFHAAILRSTDGGLSWSDPAPDLDGVGIHSIEIDPTNHNIVYAGAAVDDAVYKSTNGGLTFNPSSNGLPISSGRCLILDTKNTKTLFAGTFFLFAGVQVPGLYVSTDSAATWTSIINKLPAQVRNITTLALNQGDDSILYVGTNLGLLIVGNTTLTASVQATAGPVTIGTPISYSATVSNTGNLPATNVTLTIPIPAGAILSATSPGIQPPGVTCTQLNAGARNTSISCSSPSIAVGASLTGNFAFTVVDPQTSITTTATVSADDASPASGSATTQISTAYAVPTTTGLSQTSATQGGTSLTFDVFGNGFTDASQVLFNGSARTISFKSDQDIQVSATQADLATAHTISITVTNPTAGGGGGTSNSQTFTVLNLSQTITFSAGQFSNLSFGHTPLTLTASATSGLPVVFSIIAGQSFVSLSGTNNSTMTIIGAGGPITIQADQAGGNGFGSAPPVQRTFSIAKQNQTILFNSILNHTVGDGPFELTASASSTLPVTFTVTAKSSLISLNGSTVTILGAGGPVTIQASQGGNSNFNAAPSVSQSFSIAKVNQTITFDPIPNRTYGDPGVLLSASSTSGLPVSFSVISGVANLTGNVVTPFFAGTVTIQADQAGNANFSAAPAVQRTFTVAKANQTITFGPLANKRVGDPPFTIDATSSSRLQVNFSVVTGSATVFFNFVQFLEHVGTVVIQADQPGDVNFNPAAPVQQSFTVGKGQAFINVTDLVNVFDGSPKGVWATTTPPELGGLTVTYNGSMTLPTAIGSYAMVASLNNVDYQAANFVATMKIIGLSPTDSQNANPGGQNTASINPSGSSPGISASLNHSNNGVTANVSVGIYSDNPTERGLVNVGGGFVDVKVSKPNADDTVVINYYYPNSITGVNEAALQLYYFNGLIWLPVRGSGNSVPTKDATDDLDGTVSGGRFTVTLDNTSSPKVSGLTGTMFAATTAIMGDINGDNTVNVNDLILMANILAGNFTPTAIQKDAADDLKDQTNRINVSDLLTLANFLAGNIKTLPVGQ